MRFVEYIGTGRSARATPVGRAGSSLRWEGNDLVYETPTKRRVVAQYIQGGHYHLRTFWNGTTYFVGSGKSLMIGGGAEVETYWSTVQGASVLVHFDPATGDTAIRTGSGRVLTCTRGMP